MIFGFMVGHWQIVICVIVAFVLFGGAKKIPEFARALGKAKSEFKKGIAEGESEAAEEKKEPVKEIA